MNTQASTTSTRSRRVQYGMLSAVLVAAVAIIVVVGNWLAAQHAQRLRFDWTATRAYTLSPQTRQLLADLDSDVAIVTLFAQSVSPSAQTVRRMNQFSELLDEYALRGGEKIDVRHIDPALEAEAFEDFAAELRALYAEQTRPAERAIEAARELFEPIEAFGRRQAAAFGEAASRFTRLDPEQVRFLREVTSVLGQLDASLTLDTRARDVTRSMRQTLPNLDEAAQTARQPLNAVKSGLLDPAIEQLQQLAGSDAAGSAVTEFAAGAVADFRDLQQRITAVLDQLDASAAEQYSNARSNILEANSVVVRVGDRLTTIRLANVYTDPLVTEADEAAPEQRFRGEEAVTGAIISLTLQTPPLVVFVNGSPQPATGRRGTHAHVAQRLGSMNFQVEEWNPGGRQTQFGPMPPQPVPEPEPGQRRVWVFLAPPPPNPMAPQQDTARPVIDRLEQALEDGEPAMVFLALSPMSRFGQADPVAALLEPYAIRADTGQLIISLVMGNEGRRFPSRQHLVTRFDSTHPIARAVQGHTVDLEMAVPLRLADGNDGGVTATPLLHSPRDTWAEQQWDNRRQLPEQDEGETGGPVPVAAAVVKDAQRLIAIGDADFASNQYIVRQEMAITPDGLEAIERVQFAGNAELFVNGVYWLAGLDNLIASGARTQDVRRFDLITERQMKTVWWVVMGGVPAVCLLSGAAVWLVRRK